MLSSGCDEEMLRVVKLVQVTGLDGTHPELAQILFALGR